MHSRCPAAAGCEVNLQLGGFVHLPCCLLVVASIAVGIHAVLVGIEREVAVRQEREINFQVARSPVSHRADVPVRTIAARQQDILGYLRVENPGFIPDRRHDGKELHRFRFTQVVGRTIR